jgi:outer membrane protein assembly factor BamB
VIGIVGDENGRVYASNWMSGRVYDITDGNVALLAETGSNLNMICYSNGHIYVPSPAGAKVQRVSVGGVLESFIEPSTGGPVDGPIADAGISAPNSCSFSPDGTVLYVTDTNTGRLHRVDAGAP